MRPVYDPVNYGVGEGRLPKQLMPVVGINLAGHDGGTIATAVFQDFEQVVLLGLTRLGQAPIVNDQHVDAGDLGQEPRVGAIGAGQGQFVEEARGAAVESRVALPMACWASAQAR